MPNIKLAVPESLEKKLTMVIKTQGFSSKAEFFRFVARRALEELENDTTKDYFKNSLAAFRKSASLR